MIREDLSEVNVLRGINEEAPPEDIEEDEEDSSPQTGFVGGVEECRSQCAETDDARSRTTSTDEHEYAAAESIDVKCCPSISNATGLLD